MQPSSKLGFRLSPQQKRLWTLQGSQTQLYGSHCAVLIEGPLDQALLKRAIERVIERHEILRTSFHSPPAMSLPLQVIHHNSDLVFDHHDWQRLSISQQFETLNELFTNIPQVSSHLEHRPRWQVPLLRLAHDRHALILGLPALYADALGLRQLVAQLSRCYHSTLDDESLSDDILQYVDAAQWQNELLEVEEQAASDPYWSKQDLSPLNSLKLPGQSEVAAQGSFAPQLLTLRLETDLRWRIESIAREQETSLAIFLLACWKVVLWRLSGEAEMTVGVAFDGRNYEDLESNRTPGEVLARHLSLARGEWIQ